VTGNAELLDQTEHGEQFRVIKQNFGEDFVVKINSSSTAETKSD